MQILLMMMMRMKKKGCVLKIKKVYLIRIMFISSHWYIGWIAGHNEWAGLIYIDCIGSYV